MALTFYPHHTLVYDQYECYQKDNLEYYEQKYIELIGI